MIDRVLASTPECRDGNCPTRLSPTVIPVDLLLRAVAGTTAR